jgi:RimJ/RimL family protein N-acetyltransferase
MVLTGARCIVRSWRTGDADALVRHANNFEVARQLRDRFPHPYTPADAAAFLRHATAQGAGGRSTNLAIEVDGEAAGGIGFVSGSDIERFSAEIGYWLGEQYWGRGITTEAVLLVTAHALTAVNLLRLFALPFADNTASRRVLAKAGYDCEGILRSSSVKYGQRRDQAMYARVNETWTGGQ